MMGLPFGGEEIGKDDWWRAGGIRYHNVLRGRTTTIFLHVTAKSGFINGLLSFCGGGIELEEIGVGAGGGAWTLDSQSFMDGRSGE